MVVLLVVEYFLDYCSRLTVLQPAGGGSRRCGDGRQEVNVTDTGMGLKKRKHHHHEENVKSIRVGK